MTCGHTVRYNVDLRLYLVNTDCKELLKMIGVWLVSVCSNTLCGKLKAVKEEYEYIWLSQIDRLDSKPINKDRVDLHCI